MNLRFRRFTLSSFFFLVVHQAIGVELPPPPDFTKDEISNLYKDVIVVQRKAQHKGGTWIFNPLMSFDFSDAPKTLYSLNLDLGYAFSDFWELYGVYSPFFISQDRPLAKALHDQFVVNLNTPNAKNYWGLDLLWVPAYGKDSWGPYAIIRSDTFLKFSLGEIQYDTGSGLKVAALAGKTFFIRQFFNFRIAAGISQIESYVVGQKRSNLVGLMELGLVFYFN